MTKLKQSTGSLRKRMAAHAPAHGTPTGFTLPTPGTSHYTNLDAFASACKSVKERVTPISSHHLQRVGIDGRVVGTDWRLTMAAFSDLCHYSKIPVSFIKRLAKFDENLALEIVESSLGHTFDHDERVLVLDTESKEVLGIVGERTYSHLAHVDVLDYVFTANKSLAFTNGWLSGSSMRLTATDGEKPVEPQKGDVIHLGVSVENSIQGDGSVGISDYIERLVCTNGMVARDGEHSARILHRGDVQFNVQKSLVAASVRVKELLPMMALSTRQVLDLDTVRNVRSWLTDPKRGSENFCSQVAKKASDEAVNEGRGPGELTLWNIVNGITEMAHETKSLNRKNDLEALGYATLARYTADGLLAA